MTWKEQKVGFDTIEEARAQTTELNPTVQWRIIRVDAEGYRDVESGP
jgi:hypothetical protein